MTEELLLKFSQTPGLMTISEIVQIRNFLSSFLENLELYRSAFGEPLGFSVNNGIDRADWYIAHKSKER